MEDPSPPDAFEIAVRVEAQDIDELGHVNNTVYLRWVQAAAVAHWRALTTPQQQAELAWMVLRHEIDYKRPALPGEDVLVRTWVGLADGLKFERLTAILRGVDRRLLAQARTLWCPIDPATGRPKRTPPEVRAKVARVA
jgi:acyl-CoA thioester hydrolase